MLHVLCVIKYDVISVDLLSFVIKRRGKQSDDLVEIKLNVQTIWMLWEPRHDKTNTMGMRPAKTQISLGIRPVWSVFAVGVFAVRMKKAWVLSYPWTHSEDSSDWADAQADQCLRWALTHFVGFVMSRLYLLSTESGTKKSVDQDFVPILSPYSAIHLVGFNKYTEVKISKFLI